MQLTQVSTKHFQLHPEAPWFKTHADDLRRYHGKPHCLGDHRDSHRVLDFRIPASAFFFLGVLLFGALTGFVLWRRHSSGF